MDIKGYSIVKSVTSKVEKAELIISVLCMVNCIDISKTDIKALAYYVVYGVKTSTDTMLVKGAVVENIGSLRNLKTRLAKLGFLKSIKGTYRTYSVNLKKDFNLQAISKLIVDIVEK